MNYVIVSPIKNEEKFLRQTLDSVILQSVKPSLWVVVDDGSTDGTLDILREYSLKYNWISVVENKTHSEERAGGSKVVRAFYKGFESIKNHNYDFIVKLDGDLKLPNNYFEAIIDEFKKDSKIGLCGGLILNKINNSFVLESHNNYHVRGAFKAVRKKCFNEIGGFSEVWNWDGLDEMEAMRLGWKTSVLDLKVIHFRPTSGAYNFKIQNFKHGYEAYKTRDNFLLTLIRFVAKSIKSPYLSGIYFLKGYFSSFFSKEPRVISKELSIFTNKFHLNRIFKTVFSK
ncbi:glycosyltransferase [Polaribacter aquimarinus]|uniref:Glycosyl transferase family 2 n=1 Tax=Polaribacter aquimarinus TaxID=2100726 RepID=A0A2U2JAW0_9FLAO|nr:glycosyltransferase family A protein [Polaribacter aquimarinus]PWG05478.1 glycosyl transferase family 2 [Polaribacter aquimarinus]